MTKPMIIVGSVGSGKTRVAYGTARGKKYVQLNGRTARTAISKPNYYGKCTVDTGYIIVDDIPICDIELFRDAITNGVVIENPTGQAITINPTFIFTCNSKVESVQFLDLGCDYIIFESNLNRYDGKRKVQS